MKKIKAHEELKNNCLEDKEIICNYPSVGYELDRLKGIDINDSSDFEFLKFIFKNNK